MDRRLLEIIACPICNGKLSFDQKNLALVCKAEQLAYPVRNGIPVLLANEARAIKIDEKLE
ncbi:Trm112 family protein [Candidatus Regiella insecticola]|uniref:UPF0434 protein RINTU1_33890 n=1 Tax=Candidatus Regiella insecticola TaxID=138073 RepID=A0A6L2ZS12_9ENTR|nr:Trm112 family protein [Candidatus Regiella insecticola]GFN47362.1 UPF0434 protein [Candidatus Regiella insecticola]